MLPPNADYITIMTDELADDTQTDQPDAQCWPAGQPVGDKRTSGRPAEGPQALQVSRTTYLSAVRPAGELQRKHEGVRMIEPKR